MCGIDFHAWWFWCLTWMSTRFKSSKKVTIQRSDSCTCKCSGKFILEIREKEQNKRRFGGDERRVHTPRLATSSLCFFSSSAASKTGETCKSGVLQLLQKWFQPFFAFVICGQNLGVLILWGLGSRPLMAPWICRREEWPPASFDAAEWGRHCNDSCVFMHQEIIRILLFSATTPGHHGVSWKTLKVPSLCQACSVVTRSDERRKRVCHRQTWTTFAVAFVSEKSIIVHGRNESSAKSCRHQPNRRVWNWELSESSCLWRLRKRGCWTFLAFG